MKFPFLFGGTFIEGEKEMLLLEPDSKFPFLFGGTFIEGWQCGAHPGEHQISLPFRRDFH